MITVDLDDFMFELDDGTLKHVGAATRSATAKLYDVETVDVREFGDSRVKLACKDGEGNEIEIAMGPDAASAIARGIESMEADSRVFE